MCASAVVGVNVLRRLPRSSASSSPSWLSVGSTWYRNWLVLVFVLYVTACLMSNGGNGARYVTRKSSMVEGRWQWLPRCCMLLTGAKRAEASKKGNKGPFARPPVKRPPCDCGEDLQEAPTQVSPVFNKLAPLHVYNQQLHSLTVAHEFVDVNAYRAMAMVLHIGATREQGHFVVHILVRDEWWLCDDASATRGRPRAASRKVTFLLYERTPIEMVGPSQGGSQRGDCNRGGRGAPSLFTTTTVKRHALSMLSNTQMPAMPLPTGDSEYTTHVGEAQPSRSHSTVTTVNRHAMSMPRNIQLPPMWGKHSPVPSLSKLWQGFYKGKGYGSNSICRSLCRPNRFISGRVMRRSGMKGMQVGHVAPVCCRGHRIRWSPVCSIG